MPKSRRAPPQPGPSRLTLLTGTIGSLERSHRSAEPRTGSMRRGSQSDSLRTLIGAAVALVAAILSVGGLLHHDNANAQPGSGMAPIERPRTETPPGLARIRMGHDKLNTRIVFDSTGRTDYSIDLNASSRTLSVTLRDSKVKLVGDALNGSRASLAQGGLVANGRLGRDDQGQLRLAINLSAAASIRRTFWLDPVQGQPFHRFVIDLTPTSDVASTDNPEPKTEPQATAAEVESAQAARTVIVIDAGHGGQDPGAIGPSGLQEKTVTLAAAHQLKALLEMNEEFDVRLLRTSDETIELQSRVDRAIALEGDLFVSLHADAGEKAELRGASVYTLSSLGEAKARKLRQERDWAAADAEAQVDPTVVGILGDLKQRELQDQSAILARLMIDELGKVVPLLANPHRHDEFIVLLNPKTPAVLVEMGFMTNRRDEALLSTAEGREPVLRAISIAIDSYFSGTAVGEIASPSSAQQLR